MKVAITGHTSGIGQDLQRHFLEQGHEVRGFSRSNGYTLPDAVAKVLVQSLDCDVFVNNALPILSQIELLEKLWPKWHKQNKTIVVIGSVAAHLPFDVPGQELYQQQKRELDALCKRLRYTNGSNPCKLISINPGWVSTNIFELVNITPPLPEVCMTPQQVTQVVEYALCSPIYVQDITMSVSTNFY